MTSEIKTMRLKAASQPNEDALFMHFTWDKVVLPKPTAAGFREAPVNIRKRFSRIIF
jgi:hypothetical protein